MKFSPSRKLLLGLRLCSRVVILIGEWECFYPLYWQKSVFRTCHGGFSQEHKHFTEWKLEAFLAVRSQLGLTVEWDSLRSQQVRCSTVSLQYSSFSALLKLRFLLFGSELWTWIFKVCFSSVIPKQSTFGVGSLQGEKDWQKYETARRLKKCVDKIRNQYREDWKSKEMKVRQRAVALYFIDKVSVLLSSYLICSACQRCGGCSLLQALC